MGFGNIIRKNKGRNRFFPSVFSKKLSLKK